MTTTWKCVSVDLIGPYTIKNRNGVIHKNFSIFMDFIIRCLLVFYYLLSRRGGVYAYNFSILSFNAASTISCVCSTARFNSLAALVCFFSSCLVASMLELIRKFQQL